MSDTNPERSSAAEGGYSRRKIPIVKVKKKHRKYTRPALAIARAGHVRREENVPGEEPGRRGPRRDYKIFLGYAISNMVFESRPRRFFLSIHVNPSARSAGRDLLNRFSFFFFFLILYYYIGRSAAVIEWLRADVVPQISSISTANATSII